MTETDYQKKNNNEKGLEVKPKVNKGNKTMRIRKKSKQADKKKDKQMVWIFQ
jgi:hypothetical protein